MYNKMKAQDVAAQHQIKALEQATVIVIVTVAVTVAVTISLITILFICVSVYACML